MKTCLICPIPSLGTYVDGRATVHLLLAHLMDDPEYVAFYARRSAEGDYIILDNGAKENNVGADMYELLNAAMRVNADEVVLTDVRYKAKPTMGAAVTQLAWLQMEPGRELYNEAGRPKLMIVPQGETVQEWEECLTELLRLVGKCRETMDEMPEPTVGFAYHYDHMFVGGIRELLKRAKVHTLDVHLLGWPRRLMSLRAIQNEYPSIRSVDSGKPFSYALAHLPTHPRSRMVPRPDNFFHSAIPEDVDWLVRANINTFRMLAGDRE